MNIHDYVAVVKGTKVHSLGDAFPRTHRRKSMLDLGEDTAEQLLRDKVEVDAARRLRHRDIDSTLGISYQGRQAVDSLVTEEEVAEYLAMTNNGNEEAELDDMEKAHNAMLHRMEHKLKKQQQQQQQHHHHQHLARDSYAAASATASAHHSSPARASKLHVNIDVSATLSCSPTAAIAAASPFNKILQLASTHWTDKDKPSDSDSSNSPLNLRSGMLSGDADLNKILRAPSYTGGSKLQAHISGGASPASATPSPAGCRRRSHVCLPDEPEPTSPAVNKTYDAPQRGASFRLQSGNNGPLSGGLNSPITKTVVGPGPVHEGPKSGSSFRQAGAGLERMASRQSHRPAADLFSVMDSALQDAVTYAVIDSSDREPMIINRTKSDASLGHFSPGDSLDGPELSSNSVTSRVPLKGRRAGGIF